MNLAYGFIETLGLIGAIEAADAMLKAAKVRVVKQQQIGSGLVTVIVEGELGACQAAVNAGGAAAERVGTLISLHVIPRPFDDTEKLVRKFFDSLPKSDPPIEKPEIRNQTPIEKTQTSKTPPKNKPEPKNAEQWISSNKNGVTLDQIAQYLKSDHAEARRVVKKLMDEEKIEKVHQKYFYLSNRKKK